MNLVQNLLVAFSNNFRNCLTKELVNYPDSLKSAIETRLSFYTSGIKYYQSICLFFCSNFNEFLQAYENTEIEKTFEFYCLKRQERVLEGLQKAERKKYLEWNPFITEEDFEMK